MASTSAWGTRRKMALVMQMVALTTFTLSSNVPVQVQSAVEADQRDVVDAKGHPVVVGTEYHVLPAVGVTGGGLALKMHVHNRCPMYVVQENSEKSRALPVLFRHAEGQSGNYSFVMIVQQDLNLNLNFSAVTPCVQSTEWSSEHDANTSNGFIKASHGSSLFQIVKAIDGDGYNMYWYPCDYCTLVCAEVGIYVDGDDNRWLVIDNSAEALRVR